MNNKNLSLSILIITLVFIVSCNTNVSNYEYNNLVGRTFYLTKKTDTGQIIYNSCWAKVSKVKFYPNKFYYDPGQEPYFYKIVNFIKNKELITLQTHIFETENKELLENYSIKLVDSSRYYIYFNNEIFIDSLKKNSIPNITQPCTECYEKEICDEWVRQEKEEKETPKYTKQWQGSYSFGFGGNRMGESYEGGATIVVNDSTKKSSINLYWKKTNDETDEIVDKGNSIIPLEIVHVVKDTIELKGKKEEQYILYKTKYIEDDKKVDGYAIKGSSVYRLSPPNNDYPLIKNTTSEITYLRVIEDNLRVRSNPNLDSEKIENVSKIDILEYLNKKSTQKKTVINNGKQIEDYWYKIKTPSGNIGWVHGCCVVFDD